VLQAAISNNVMQGTPSPILYCYCKDIMFAKIKANPLADIKTELNATPGCKDFVKNFVLSNFIVIIVPLVISIITFAAKKILQIITDFEMA
jgi:hypothetical protein